MRDCEEIEEGLGTKCVTKKSTQMNELGPTKKRKEQKITTNHNNWK